MEDKDKKVEVTTEADTSTAETKTTVTTDADKGEVAIDYDKELQEQVEKFERAERNREGYQQRKSKTEAKNDDEEEEDEDNKQSSVEAQVAAALAKELPKFIPKIQGTLAEDAIETLLTEFSGGNESKKKLLRWNFENSVAANGTMRERMENALLITDKKAIQKKQAEMATALQNRAGLGASGLGSSTEGQVVADNILTADQFSDLKAKGWDDKKIERFKKNLRK